MIFSWGQRMEGKKKDVRLEDSPPPERRRFLLVVWVGIGIAAFAELVWVVLSFLKPGRKNRRAGSADKIMQVGPATQFAPHSVTAFPRGRFYLVRLEDGGFLALHRRCTHLGCTVPWDEGSGQFLCPCHSSAFDIRGAVIRPPAPRALDIFPVIIENNVVFVDTCTTIQRSGFRPEQVVYPKKPA